MVSLPNRALIGIFLLLMVFGCQEDKNNAVIDAAKAYQTTIDENIALISGKKKEIRQQINDNLQAKQDTFVLAKQLPILNNAIFLLNSKHDYITKSITQFQAGQIKEDSLKNVITNGQTYTDSLMINNDLTL